jgi:ABC-2 type transport system permease protein
MMQAASLTPALRKWRAVLGLHFQDSLAYRAQGVVWILTDIIPTVTLPLMWLAAYGDRTHLRGFSKEGLVAYYLAVSVVSNLVFAHPWEIARDIKDGRLSIYLTRPFTYYGFIFASNLTWRLVRTMLYIPFFLGILAIFRHYLSWGGFQAGREFWAALVLAHLLSFQIAWLLGMAAFYLVEVGGVYEFWYMIGGFLAGQMAPLELLPEAARAAAQVMPFSYVLWFPVQVFLGNLPQEVVMRGLVVQAVWTVVIWLAGQALWRAGLRKYTAVGI